MKIITAVVVPEKMKGVPKMYPLHVTEQLKVRRAVIEGMKRAFSDQAFVGSLYRMTNRSYHNKYVRMNVIRGVLQLREREEILRSVAKEVKIELAEDEKTFAWNLIRKCFPGTFSGEARDVDLKIHKKDLSKLEKKLMADRGYFLKTVIRLMHRIRVANNERILNEYLNDKPQ